MSNQLMVTATVPASQHKQGDSGMAQWWWYCGSSCHNDVNNIAVLNRNVKRTKQQSTAWTATRDGHGKGNGSV